MNVLARVMRAAWDEIKIPETCVKRTGFEHYVRERLFPEETYDVPDKFRDRTENRRNRAARLKAPSLRLKSKNNGAEWYVVAKFCARYHEGKLGWSGDIELKRYQEIDNTTPVLIAIGTGGRPSAPGKVFLIPVSHIRFIKLYPLFLKRYEIPPDRSISPGYLKSIL